MATLTHNLGVSHKIGDAIHGISITKEHWNDCWCGVRVTGLYFSGVWYRASIQETKEMWLGWDASALRSTLTLSRQAARKECVTSQSQIDYSWVKHCQAGSYLWMAGRLKETVVLLVHTNEQLQPWNMQVVHLKNIMLTYFLQRISWILWGPSDIMKLA